MNYARQHGTQHGKHSMLLLRPYINLICRVFSRRLCLGTSAETQVNEKTIILKHLSVNKATHENTLFSYFPWQSFQLKTYSTIYKARARNALAT